MAQLIEQLNLRKNRMYNDSPTDLITIKEVEKTTGFKKSVIYLRIKQGVFPNQVKLGSRTARWIRGEIEAWKQEQINLRDERIKKQL